jgi:hypothetical protein
MSAAKSDPDYAPLIGAIAIFLWALFFSFWVRPYLFCLVIGHVLGGIHVSYWDGLILSLLVGGPHLYATAKK